MKCAKCVSTLWLVLSCMPAHAELSARALLDKSRDYVAAAPAIRRVDTSEKSAVVTVGQSRIEHEPQTTVVTIEIEMPKQRARQTATLNGQELVVLKQGEKAAMKLGAGPWEIPTGRHFENIAKDMGNLFVCEIETPETKENAPTWKVVGTELLDGDEAFVVETEGNTAAPLAQERMVKGLTKVFPGNPAERPSVKVLEYSAKHWIRKSDFCPLLAVQISKVEVSFARPDGLQQSVEQFSKTTSSYSYDQVAIEIPADAERLLSDSNSPLQETDRTERVPAATDK